MLVSVDEPVPGVVAGGIGAVGLVVVDGVVVTGGFGVGVFGGVEAVPEDGFTKHSPPTGTPESHKHPISQSVTNEKSGMGREEEEGWGGE